MNISKLQSDSLRTTLNRVLRLFNPPPVLNVWQWGELRRRMGKNVTAKPGRYRVATAPYQREPQEQITARDVAVLVLMWAKRLGKTEIINNLHGAIIEQSPRNILHCMPTLDSAKKWSKQFFMPMVRAIPIFRNLIKDTRQKDANNTILSKEFPGGTISAIGANSPSGFRQVQAPVVTCDEIDAMDDGIEGDPVELAFGRAENYPDSIQVVSSTPTRTGSSRIESWFQKSDQRKWFCPCPDCGSHHVLAWDNVKWPEGKTEEAVYQCPDCKANWDDAKRVKAVMSGEWRPTAPFNGIRGYWLNGLNTTFSAKKGYRSKLHQMASEAERAKANGEAAFIFWKNTFLCETHEEKAEKLMPEPLLQRAEDYSPQKLPAEVLMVTTSVDVQKNYVEALTVGWGKDSQAWGIETKKILGNTEAGEAWPELAKYLGSRFKREDGIELLIAGSAIDCRHRPSSVFKFVRTCAIPHVYPVYGVGFDQPVLVYKRVSKHYRINTWAVATLNAKDAIFARLQLEEVGPRYIHFPKAQGFNADFFEQLTAEEVRWRIRNGHRIRYYEKVRDRNEALDLFVYQLAIVDILRPRFDAIAKNIQKNTGDGESGGGRDDNIADPLAKDQTPDFVKTGRIVGRRRFGPSRGAFTHGWQ